MSRHAINPDTLRCFHCGAPGLRCIREPVCCPDDGATLVGSLCESTPDPFFGLTMAESYMPPPVDVKE